MPKNKAKKSIIYKGTVFFSFIFGGILAGYFWLPQSFSISYDAPKTYSDEIAIRNEINDIQEPKIIVTHIGTPKPLKSVYMSSWAAGSNSFRQKILKILDETEINAIVIDVKDYTGRISFEVVDPAFKEIGSVENRIPDIIEFIDLLHKRNVYVIGRISSFQDPYMTKKRPDLAVKKMSNKEQVWKDKKGISWIDAGSKDFWDYIVAIGKEAYSVGFDELNFDYIRFPSDGDIKNIYYPFSEGKIKADVLKEFFGYLSQNLKSTGAILSADLFGMIMTNDDDLGIGQILENTVPYFDYVTPMVYPSHFSPTWNGFKNPASVPYDVVKISIGRGVERLKMIGEDPLKLRPWLQDFNLGATYTAPLVRAQIQATYDVGLSSWMLWDPKNVYTFEALEKEASGEKTTDDM